MLTCLRFGMLPAQVMDSVRRCLAARFSGTTQPRHLPPGETHTMVLADENPESELQNVWRARHGNWPRVVDFSLREAVEEALHLITLEFYKQGNLVV